MLHTKWAGPAWAAGMDAAAMTAAPKTQRKRWAGQADWDAENMRTESTRFPADLDTKLREYCREAHVSRYYLINYMLRVWIAAWEGVRNDNDTGNAVR